MHPKPQKINFPMGKLLDSRTTWMWTTTTSVSSATACVGYTGVDFLLHMHHLSLESILCRYLINKVFSQCKLQSSFFNSNAFAAGVIVYYYLLCKHENSYYSHCSSFLKFEYKFQLVTQLIEGLLSTHTRNLKLISADQLGYKASLPNLKQSL